MKMLPSFDKALTTLEGQEALYLILGDWDSGLQLFEGLPGEQATGKIEDAKQNYGERFSWQVFNRNVYVSWNGECAIVCDEPIKNEKVIFLETDYRRFKGVSIFHEKGFSEVRYNRAKVEEILQDGKVVYLRLIDLFKEDEEDGS